MNEAGAGGLSPFPLHDDDVLPVHLRPARRAPQGPPRGGDECLDQQVGDDAGQDDQRMLVGCR